MHMNENLIKGKWKEIKGEIQKSWGKLTDDELEKTKGDMKAIGGLIQQRYGHAQEKSRDTITEIFKRFESNKNKAVIDLKKKIKH